MAQPDCPKCGCNAIDLVAAGEQWGRPWARFVCDYCGHEFTLGQRPKPREDGVDNGVVYVPTRCPSCRSRKTRVTSTLNERTRYHVCDDCGKRFKSIEADQTQPARRKGW